MPAHRHRLTSAGTSHEWNRSSHQTWPQKGPGDPGWSKMSWDDAFNRTCLIERKGHVEHCLSHEYTMIVHGNCLWKLMIHHTAKHLFVHIINTPWLYCKWCPIFTIKSRASVRWCWWESYGLSSPSTETQQLEIWMVWMVCQACMSSHKFQVEHIPILKNATWIDLDK